MQETNDKDLRVIRTKKAIQNALVDLIEEKGFDKITVKNITTKAKINRGTFYAHYEDKYDLMKKCQDEFMYGFTKVLTQNISNVIAEFSKASQSTQLVSTVNVFEFLNKQSKFIKAMLNSEGYSSLQTTLRNFMWEEVLKKNPEFIKVGDSVVPVQYFAAYITSAHIEVIKQWLNSGKKESPREIAEILLILSFNEPFLR